MANHIVAILALGFSMVFGGLQMSSCSYWTPFLVASGFIIVVPTTGYYLWKLASGNILKIGVGVLLLSGLFMIACGLIYEAHVSATAEKFITAYERNGELWGRSPNKPIRLERGAVLSWDKSKPKVPITLVFGDDTLDDTILEGSDIVVTIPMIRGKVRVEYDREVWRPLDSVTHERQRYWAKLGDVIRPGGRSMKGPNGTLTVEFPVGNYRIDYRLEGLTAKNCGVMVENYYSIDVR